MSKNKCINLKMILSWSFVIIWMGIIFLLSHQPASESNRLSKNVTDIIIETIDKVVPDAGIETAELNSIVRKYAHFFAYMVLGILLMNAFSFNKKRNVSANISLSLLASILYAISDEAHQMFVPGRGALVTDVLIDTAGALIGILLLSAARILLTKIKNAKYAREND